MRGPSLATAGGPSTSAGYDRYHTPERPTATIAQVYAMPARFAALKDRLEFGPPKSAAGVRVVALPGGCC